MINVPADIAGQSKHAADWLDGRKEQGPSPVLARARRQMEELEVDWAHTFAVPETESVTVPKPKKKRTEEPAATSHLPPAISASHTAKPPHPPGKVLAQKTADQQLLAQAAQRVQRQAEEAKKKEDEAKKKKKEEEEKRKKKEKEEEEKRKKKEKEEEERRKKKEKEEEEKRRKKAEEGKAEKVMQRALSVSLHVLCISSRVLCSVLRVLCLCYASALLFPGKQDGTAAGTPAAARIKAILKQPVPVPDQPQEQGGPCGSSPPSTAFKAKQQSRADADKEARDELMQRRDWSYKDGYKPRWIIYCTTAIAPMIVEGAEIKPAGASRAFQDHLAVSSPTISGAPANKGSRRRKRTTGRSSCPAARCSPPKAKRMRSWTSAHGSRGGRRTRPMQLRTSAPTQRP